MTEKEQNPIITSSKGFRSVQEDMPEVIKVMKKESSKQASYKPEVAKYRKLVMDAMKAVAKKYHTVLKALVD